MKQYNVPFRDKKTRRTLEACIRVPETQDDLREFVKWANARKDKPIAVDTETTGLDIFSDGFRCRTVQVGHSLDAWVLNVEDSGIDKDILERILNGRELYFQNAAYDVQVLKRCFGYGVDWNYVTDTKILAHLIDSRPKKDGGFGHSLQELTAEFISEEVAEKIKGSMNEMAKEIGCKKGELFATIDPWNDTYLTYAGMDVVLTYRLRAVLDKQVPARSRKLIRYEHEVARVCCEIGYNGFLLDREYSLQLSKQLEEEQELWEAMALLEYGVESVNSNAEVAEAIIEAGYKLNEVTASGAWKMDKTVLERLSNEGCTLADYVMHAKKAKKWRKTWVDTFLETADSDGRCHATINPLQARTGRMSITGIPAQTLPSNDWRIRRCFIAEPGYLVVSCDYQAQELRVLAALSGDPTMKKAFAEDADLHQMTADASGVDRKVGKTVNFAYVYGSGPKNIADTCGISVAKAKEVISGFERTYPGVKNLSQKLQKQAEGSRRIYTRKGRKLMVDKERPYAALNYMIQSTSRDVTCEALLRLDEAGFTPYLRLPIHDEILAVVPEGVAASAAQKIADIMADVAGGVLIGTDADVLGPSWGSGYITEDAPDYEKYLSTFKEEEAR